MNGYEEYDLREQQEKFRENERKARAKANRWVVYQNVGMSICAAAVLITIVVCIYLYNIRPEVPDPVEIHLQQLEEKCVDKGGIWLDPAGASNQPVCVFSEKGATE